VYGECCGGLTFESLVTDPLTRLVMDSDGISIAEMIAVLEAASHAVARREQMSEAPVLC
jgi:hypothetical protein